MVVVSEETSYPPTCRPSRDGTPVSPATCVHRRRPLRRRQGTGPEEVFVFGFLVGRRGVGRRWVSPFVCVHYPRHNVPRLRCALTPTRGWPSCAPPITTKFTGASSSAWPSQSRPTTQDKITPPRAPRVRPMDLAELIVRPTSRPRPSRELSRGRR